MPDAATRLAEALVSPARLRIDPNFLRFRGFPKFGKLLSSN